VAENGLEDKANDRAGSMRSSDRMPVPDPTVLTTQALYREVAALQELIEQRLTNLGHSTDDKFDGVDKVEELTNRERVGQLSSLKEILEQRIESLEALVSQQFDLVERQRVEQKKDTKDAVDAALTAQKEAVREQTVASERSIAKSEGATSKQLEQQQATFATAIEGLRRSIDEVKERSAEDARNIREALVSAERNLRESIAAADAKASALANQGRGASESRGGLYAGLAAIVGVLVVGLTILGFVIR
jgi:hypothetical protein